MTQQTLLDRYMPDYAFWHRYDIVVENGDIDTVFEIARNVDLSRSRVIPMLFKLRGLPTQQLTARAFTRAMSWSEIEQNAPHAFLIGYWRGQKIEPVIDLDHFMSLPEEATQKVVFSFSFHPLGRDRVRVETETRVQCLDWKSEFKFRLYWLAIKPFSALVRKEVLRLIKSEAEMRNGEPGTRQKMEMVVKLPTAVLAPLQLYFQTVGRISPAIAVSSFKALLSRMPRTPLRSKDHAFLATGKRRDFTCEGAVLAGYEFGEGPTVLVVHGLAGSAANYRSIIPALVSAGYRVVAFDSVSHGNSPDGQAFSNQAIRHLVEIFHQLGDLHAIISHSAGTYLTMMALLQYPASSRLKKCIYLAPYAHIRITLQTFMDYFRVPDSNIPALSRWFEEIGGGLPFEEQGFESCLPRHRTPDAPAHLFIHDADDRHVPLSHTRRMLAGRDESALLVTHGLGHFNILKDDGVIDAILRFIDERSH